MKLSKWTLPALLLLAACQSTGGDIGPEVGKSTEINTGRGQTEGVPFDTCKPEKGVKFEGTASSRLTTQEMEDLLVGNTLLSVDRYGTVAIYYPTKGETVGWMPKEKSKRYSWSRGKVTFEDDKYCRTWKEWKSGKSENCWEIHKGPDHVDSPGFYFVCQNGVPDGEVNVVLAGNIFEVSASGNGAKTGTLTQNDEKATEVYTKYFGKYVNK